jgi:broad specificity phosphatase PhoE
MRLYIIRHGQSTNNALADQRDRVSDPPLTELGKLQAETLARHLVAGTEPEPPDNGESSHHHGGYGITRLYCSPMWRALQTAEPIGQALDLTPQVWADLHERGGIFLDHGDGRGPIGYPGKTREEIQSAFPHYSLGEGILDHGWWNRAYEDWPECHGRAARVAGALHHWAEGSDERIVILSHVDFIDALLKSLFKQLSDDRSLYYYLYNAAISRIDFQSNGCLDIRYLNQVGHMPPTLISGNPRRPFACPTP